ncbi:hypothetical protein ACPPVS_15890 [Cellulomonas sp. McL0617]|uniref:hypothetical protein n=1 Tax=Cellulomonas sp. McL0617 TaxID=3415675 RepID=UPI003CE6CF77
MRTTHAPAARRRPRRQHLVQVELDEDDQQPPETTDGHTVHVPGSLLLVAALVVTAIVTAVGTLDRTPADATPGCPGSAACTVAAAVAARHGACQWQGYTPQWQRYAATAPDGCEATPTDRCALLTAGPSAEVACRYAEAQERQNMRHRP